MPHHCSSQRTTPFLPSSQPWHYWLRKTIILPSPSRARAIPPADCHSSQIWAIIHLCCLFWKAYLITCRDFTTIPRCWKCHHWDQAYTDHTYWQTTSHAQTYADTDSHAGVASHVILLVNSRIWLTNTMGTPFAKLGRSSVNASHTPLKTANLQRGIHSKPKGPKWHAVVCTLWGAQAMVYIKAHWYIDQHRARFPLSFFLIHCNTVHLSSPHQHLCPSLGPALFKPTARCDGQSLSLHGI